MQNKPLHRFRATCNPSRRYSLGSFDRMETAFPRTKAIDNRSQGQAVSLLSPVTWEIRVPKLINWISFNWYKNKILLKEYKFKILNRTLQMLCAPEMHAIYRFWVYWRMEPADSVGTSRCCAVCSCLLRAFWGCSPGVLTCQHSLHTPVPDGVRTDFLGMKAWFS